MKIYFLLLAWVILNNLLAQENCLKLNQCANLDPLSMIVLNVFSPPGSGGWKLTNNTSYNLLIPYKFDNPDFQSLLNSGKVNSCGIYSPFWSDWSAWSACTVPCGGGTQTRIRTCDFPAGAVRPCPDAIPCVGTAIETQACNTQPCCVKQIVIYKAAEVTCKPCDLTCPNGCGCKYPSSYTPSSSAEWQSRCDAAHVASLKKYNATLNDCTQTWFGVVDCLCP